MTVAVNALPWSSLRLQGNHISWSDLRTLATAAAESAEVREQLIHRADIELGRQVTEDRYDDSDLSDLGVAAVFAMAADQLSEEAKGPVIDYLLRMLKRASDTGVDYLEEAAERAAGRFGPALIGPLCRLIEENRCRLHCWFPAFALLSVAEMADSETKRDVARFCRRMVRECQDSHDRFILALGPAACLEALNDRESLPLLRALYEESNDPHYQLMIHRMEAGDTHAPRPWHVPVEDWLPDIIADLHDAARAEVRASQAPAKTRPTEPGPDREEEANYTNDWKRWLQGKSQPQSQDGDSTGKPDHVAPITRDEPKVRRNDLCPCGSGKKYKKCCGR